MNEDFLKKLISEVSDDFMKADIATAFEARWQEFMIMSEDELDQLPDKTKAYAMFVAGMVFGVKYRNSFLNRGNDQKDSE